MSQLSCKFPYYRVRYFVLLFLSVYINSKITLYAQQALFTNEQHLSVDDGLPQSFISEIIQDKDGFIWLSTLDGLCRYDGRSFRIFRSRSGDSNSISKNAINTIAAQPGNSITLIYEGWQADNFNLETFKVSRNKVYRKLALMPQALWKLNGVDKTSARGYFIAANYKGAGWVDHRTGAVTYANKANGLLQQDTITAIIQSPEGKIFFVSHNAVQVGEPHGKKFRYIAFNTQMPKFPSGILLDELFWSYSIVLLPGNRIAAANGENIVILDINKKNSRLYQLPPVPFNGTYTIGPILKTDTKGRLYFSSYGRIFRINEQGDMQLLWETPLDKSLRITSFLIDRSDVLWVSINAQGLLKINLQGLPFKAYAYKNNFVTDILEQAGVPPAQSPAGWKNLFSPYFFRQGEDSKGNKYVTANFYNKNEVYQLGKEGFRSFLHVPRNTIYSGLTVMPGDEVQVFDQLNMTWYQWKNMAAIPDTMMLDKAQMNGVELAGAAYIGGYTWLSTYSHGLLQYKGRKLHKQYGGVQANGNLPMALTEICRDPLDSNRFWIGSRGGGLILWDVKKGLQKIYTTDDGLPNNTVYCILSDKKGNIWCSTNKGLFAFNEFTRQLRSFEKGDGLPGNEFNRAHKFTFPDGRLAFGGLDGYVIFDPADFELKKTPEAMPVSLTGLQVNNQQQDVTTKESIIQQPITTLTHFELPYNKNYLRFEFAALLYNQPQKIKYRYQLKGADAGWIDNGTINTATYAALRPGDYTFRINATDNNGLWSKTIKEVSFRINPPFWATWWAYLAYLLIGAALVRMYFIAREQAIKTRQNLVFEKREALRLKEVDEVKDRFFSNITHEFRTPLTLIITPLEKLEQDPSLSAAATGTIATIKKNAAQLLRLINQFLDFSKMDDGQLKLKPAAGELALFAESVVELFEVGAKEKNIQLHFSPGNVAGHYLFDDEKWEKIVVNLLSNALKFTPVNGTVNVLLMETGDGHISLTVNDNGVGIHPEQQAKVFDRFYQADDSAIRNYGGTGIGLALVKELCDLMKGSIAVESEPGVFTRFTATLPVQKVTEPLQGQTMNHTAMEAAATNSTVTSDAPLLLIVEDNDELRAFLAEALGHRYRVLQAADGLIAWQLILQELPDLIISDVMMPGQDGYDLCRACKTDDRTSHICFILLTSKAAHEAKMKGLENGADDYITKPFHLSELEQRTINSITQQEKIRAHLQAQINSASPEQGVPEVTNPFLLKLYEHIDAGLTDPQLGVEYLSKAMAMSRSTLNRKLKTLLDISTNDIIRKYRLQKAAGLLSSGVDITTTAYQVGFSSPSYFSQCFKEQFRITPSEYVSKQA